LPIRALPNGATTNSPQPGRHRSELVVAINWNHWSPSIGTTGPHRLDLVVGINWNDWSSSIGTGGRHHVVRAPRLRWQMLTEGLSLRPDIILTHSVLS
jgi:hypothetical protein